MQAQEVARRISGAVAGEHQVKNSLPSAHVSGAVGRSFVVVAEVFLAPLPGKERSIQVGLTNSSPAFTFFASCLSFSSPPLHICRFHLPFSFAVFICLLPFSFASFLLACVPVCLLKSSWLKTRFHLPFSFAVFICLLPFSFASFLLACVPVCLLKSSWLKTPNFATSRILIIMILLVLRLLPPLVRNHMKSMLLC